MIWAGQREHKERGPAAGGISDAERELFDGIRAGRLYTEMGWRRS
ncbi:MULTISPECIES: hypothetical protein [Streptomyces]|nr:MULTISPECIES: hypothetical protein [Streptomyces]